MRKAILSAVASFGIALSVLSSGGCAAVASSLPTATNLNGDAWYTECKGFFGLCFSSKVYYCPTPQGVRPAACREARMVEKPKSK